MKLKCLSTICMLLVLVTGANALEQISFGNEGEWSPTFSPGRKTCTNVEDTVQIVSDQFREPFKVYCICEKGQYDSKPGYNYFPRVEIKLGEDVIFSQIYLRAIRMHWEDTDLQILAYSKASKDWELKEDVFIPLKKEYLEKIEFYKREALGKISDYLDNALVLNETFYAPHSISKNDPDLGVPLNNSDILYQARKLAMDNDFIAEFNDTLEVRLKAYNKAIESLTIDYLFEGNTHDYKYSAMERKQIIDMIDALDAVSVIDEKFIQESPWTYTDPESGEQISSAFFRLSITLELDDRSVPPEQLYSMIINAWDSEFPQQDIEWYHPEKKGLLHVHLKKGKQK